MLIFTAWMKIIYSVQYARVAGLGILQKNFYHVIFTFVYVGKGRQQTIRAFEHSCKKFVIVQLPTNINLYQGDGEAHND